MKSFKHQLDSSHSPQQLKPNLNENKRLGRTNFQTLSYSGSILSKPTVSLTTKNKKYVFTSKPSSHIDLKNKGKKRETAEEKFDAIFRQSEKREKSPQPKKMKVEKSSLFADSDDDSDSGQNNFRERLSNSQPTMSLSKKNSPTMTSNLEFDFTVDKIEKHRSIKLDYKITKNQIASRGHSDIEALFGFDDDDRPAIPTSYRSVKLNSNNNTHNKGIKLGPTAKVAVIKSSQIPTSQNTSNGTVLRRNERSPEKRSTTNCTKDGNNLIYKKENILLPKGVAFMDKKSKTLSKKFPEIDKKSVNVKLRNNPTHPDVKKETSTKNKFTGASYNSRPWIDGTKEMSQLDTTFAKPDQPSKTTSNSTSAMQKLKSTYTYVKHVKNYQNCLDEGEEIKFKDEMEYLLEGIQQSQTTLIRCSSIIKLAQNCKELNFRLYLRAHNVGDKIFEHLHDSKQHESLALATALLFFTLSRDRQFEINKKTLGLLLQLIDPLEKEKNNRYNANADNATNSNKPTIKYKLFKSKMSGGGTNRAAQDISATLKSVDEVLGPCKADLVDGNDISAKRLASEAFLRFNARRTPSWFKDEVRLRGGLDHIILQVKTAIEELKSTQDEKLQQRKLDLLLRLLAILENTVKESPMNVMYLITHEHAVLIKEISSLLSTCSNWLRINYESFIDKNVFESDETEDLSPTYKSFYNCFLQTYKLLVYITNDSEWISSRVGEVDGILPMIISTIFTTPQHLQRKHHFELLVASLALLVNLMESSPKNRITLMRMKINDNNDISSSLNKEDKPVVQSIVELFVSRESEAEENEILGEVGSKRALSNSQKQSSTSSSQPTKEQSGHWVESTDGMEWVPSEMESVSMESLSQGSQSSQRSTTSEFSTQSNPELLLTEEEKTEMKQTLDKANDHMEHSMVASYAALVLGCLIHGNHANLDTIRNYLPVAEQGFVSIIAMLKKFFSFMTLMAGISKKGEKTLSDMIEDLEELTSKPPLKL